MKPTGRQKKQKQGDRIAKFIQERYKIALPEQAAVVDRLVEFSKDNDIPFTTKGLHYLMNEIRDKEAIGAVTKENITGSLDKILGEFAKKRKQLLIGQKTIKTITSAIGCPKPWC